jgi:nucleoid-associated protein YgaU
MLLMTRETKVGLLAGMAIILLIGIIVSDYLVVPASPVPPQVQQFASQTQDNIHPPGLVMVPTPLVIPTAAKVEDMPVVPTPRDLAPAPRPAPVSQGTAPQFDEVVRNPMMGPTAPAAPAQPLAAPQPQHVASRDTLELQQKLDAAAGSSASVAAPARDSALRTITVEEGDSLYQLAAEHLGSASRFSEIYEANRDQLKAPNQLKVGMKLRLPASASAGAGQVTAIGASDGLPVVTDAPVAPAAPKPGKTYSVKASDTLYSIAQAQLGSGGRWREIYQLNRQALGGDEDALKVGQTLKLPAR